MNARELRSVIARSGKTRIELARAMGTTARTLQNKLAGRTQFKEREIKALSQALSLGMGDVDRIFFG